MYGPVKSVIKEITYISLTGLCCYILRNAICSFKVKVLLANSLNYSSQFNNNSCCLTWDLRASFSYTDQGINNLTAGYSVITQYSQWHTTFHTILKLDNSFKLRLEVKHGDGNTTEEIVLCTALKTCTGRQQTILLWNILNPFLPNKLSKVTLKIQKKVKTVKRGKVILIRKLEGIFRTIQIGFKNY